MLLHTLICVLFARFSCEEVTISGPGLIPDKIVLPARYFYVNITSEENKINYNASDLDVDITGKAKRSSHCRLWVNKLDRKDGTFIVRYKMYDTCYDFSISIFFKKRHVSGSPLSFKGPIYADQCNCPEEFDLWLENNQCPKSYQQIEKDLKAFPKVNMERDILRIIEMYHRPESTSFCHYVVENNEVYRDCYGKHVGFKMFSDNILLFLLRKVKLPDMEFVMNLGDWPLVKKGAELLPIFSWCGSDETIDIVMPTYDLTESTLENMGRVTLDTLSVQGNTPVPWAQREARAIWRGRDSRRERLQLIDIARAHPDLINASLTNFFFFRDMEEQYGPKQPHISFYNFFVYKYQISVDGTVAAYRLPYLLAGGGLVLKQDSPYYEHFYSGLIPWEHYVPVRRDLSDLVERVRWAQANDQRAKEIANNARAFANEHLLPQHVVCYHAVLFNEWSKRLENKIRVRDGMTAVPQPASKCDCAAHRDEL